MTVFLVKDCVDIEDLLCVNCVGVSWAKVIIDIIEEYIDRAVTIGIALLEPSCWIGCIAAVSVRSESVLVGLHEVKLRAEVPTNF